MSNDSGWNHKAAYEVARYVGIPGEAMGRWLSALKMCGYTINGPLAAHRQFPASPSHEDDSRTQLVTHPRDLSTSVTNGGAPMPDTPSTCAHGQLRRSCEICDLERQVAELREIAEFARPYVARVNAARMMCEDDNAFETSLLARIDAALASVSTDQGVVDDAR